jgi:hypothetical protein
MDDLGAVPSILEKFRMVPLSSAVGRTIKNTARNATPCYLVPGRAMGGYREELVGLFHDT